MNALSQISSLRMCQPELAVGHFLKAMGKSAEATFPDWYAVLKAGLEDCRLPYDIRRQVFDGQPLADYYLAGVVGLEASKIRALFNARDAAELLVRLGEQVDSLAQRTDRLVSAVVFDIVSRVEILSPDQHKLPHDQAVRVIMERMDLHSFLETRHLFSDILFRHQLGEPLARGVPSWWEAFHAKFVLAGLVEPVTTTTMTIAPPPVKRRARQLV